MRRVRMALTVAVALCLATLAIGVSPAAADQAPSVRIADAGVVERPDLPIVAKSVVALSQPLGWPECVWYHTVSGTAHGA